MFEYLENVPLLTLLSALPSALRRDLKAHRYWLSRTWHPLRIALTSVCCVSLGREEVSLHKLACLSQLP